ncbi:hypothetical protein, partial [Mesorhizobium sp.]|uniref:hypothetical protein n=1 Tax=Mesorhizobium sp. TaxID=1871066 RepID=UPI0025C01A14
LPAEEAALEQFQEKCEAVFRPELRQNKLVPQHSDFETLQACRARLSTSAKVVGANVGDELEASEPRHSRAEQGAKRRAQTL